jgi:hypothetical protein
MSRIRPLPGADTRLQHPDRTVAVTGMKESGGRGSAGGGAG